MNEPKRIKHLIFMLTAPTGSAELNDWEERFIASIEQQFARSGTLTDAQYDKLEEVYERVQS